MAGASDTSESSKSILTTVEKCVECPVCLETAKVPFKLCSRGHIICLSCTTKLSKCPTCKGPFILENPVCLKNILEALPRRCIYSQDGCEEIVEPGNDHEKFCGYRPIVCRITHCSFEMPVVKVLDHYKQHHGYVRIITETSVEGLTFADLQRYTPVCLFDNLFWILKFWDVATYAFKIFFLATPIGKPNHDYYVRITIENGDFVVTNTLNAKVSSREKEHTYKDLQKTASIELSDECERFCMKIPHWQINNMTLKAKNTEIKLKLFIFNTTKE